jgi:hypothetical protein
LIGDFWEGRTAKALRKGNLDAIIEGHMTIKAEQSIRKDIGGVLVSGRADFIQTCQTSGQTLVVECKAVTSSARRSKCIRKRDPDDAHVVQLILTMLLADATQGELRYAYVHFNNEHDNFMIPYNTDKGDSSCTMPVTLSDNGDINVDGTEWGSIEEIYLYLLKASKEVPGNCLPDRPFEDPTNPYASPCNRCVFSSVCDSTDAEEMVSGTHLAKDVLIEKAQQCANAEKPFIPKIFKPKRNVEGE